VNEPQERDEDMGIQDALPDEAIPGAEQRALLSEAWNALALLCVLIGLIARQGWNRAAPLSGRRSR